MDATTNIVMSAPNQLDTQNIKVTNQPKTVKLNDKNPQKKRPYRRYGTIKTLR